MATVHIGAEKGDIAPRVLMPGDQIEHIILLKNI